MDLYAVIGHPIAHSKSPEIHGMFAKSTGQNLSYTAIQAPLEKFDETVNSFFAKGGKGLNVTVPFKQEAFLLAQALTDDAKLAGAVNTLWQQNGTLWGDTTDGEGLVRDLRRNCSLTLKNARILVLGAGGAVRGVLAPLLREHPAALVISNRTDAKAEELAAQFSDLGPISACPLAELEDAFDLVINGTSASLGGQLPALPDGVIGSQTVCYDMMYGSEETAFNRWARHQGAKACIDGLGMLVEQAACSFQRWRQQEPETMPVIKTLRS